jgi:hypothetical protein
MLELGFMGSFHVHENTLWFHEPGAYPLTLPSPQPGASRWQNQAGERDEG